MFLAGGALKGLRNCQSGEVINNLTTFCDEGGRISCPRTAPGVGHIKRAGRPAAMDDGRTLCTADGDAIFKETALIKGSNTQT